MTRSDEEIALIQQIAERAVQLYARFGHKANPTTIAFELRTVHELLCPLRLKELLEADDSNFAHDIGGIHQHVVIGNHTRLIDCFVPRFAIQ